MNNINPEHFTYIITAFLFQVVLIAYFATRKWRFNLAIHYGWIVYALAIPAVIVSLALIQAQAAWYFWLGGLLYLTWAIFGYWIEYFQELERRNPIRWSILIPYITLYLATVMFYWWPLARLSTPLWYAGCLLFLASTVLNVTSHKRGEAISNEAENIAQPKTHMNTAELK